jgi:hypothetical protein
LAFYRFGLLSHWTFGLLAFSRLFLAFSRPCLGLIRLFI